MDRVKVIWVPYVPRARPSVSPQGRQTGILGFSQKGTGAKSVDMATTQKLSRGRLFCDPASPSLKPRAVNLFFASDEKFPPKNQNNGHNALIWYLLHSGSITSDETRVIWLLPVYIVSYIPFPNLLHK